MPKELIVDPAVTRRREQIVFEPIPGVEPIELKIGGAVVKLYVKRSK